MRAITKAGLAIGLATSVAASGCGGSSSEPAAAPPASSFAITIANMSFSPLDLRAPPGATITVINNDGAEPHSVTSEASPNAFTPGAVNGISFDTGTFTGTRQFTLPSNAQSGTVIPFFCSNHMGMMTTPNGSITIDPSATAGSPPAGGGGGGGGY